MYWDLLELERVSLEALFLINRDMILFLKCFIRFLMSISDLVNFIITTNI